MQIATVKIIFQPDPGIPPHLTVERLMTDKAVFDWGFAMNGDGTRHYPKDIAIPDGYEEMRDEAEAGQENCDELSHDERRQAEQTLKQYEAEFDAL